MNLFSCFKTRNQVVVDAYRPDYSLKDREQSALKIQSLFRGFQTRKNYISFRLYSKYNQICQLGDFSSMQRAPAGKTKVYLPLEIPSIVIKLTGRERAIFRISQMDFLKGLLKKEKCKHIIIPKAALCGNYLIEERILIQKSEEESVKLYLDNLNEFSAAVKEMVRIFSKTYIHFLVNSGISFVDRQPTVLKVRYDNICPIIENGIGKIALIDLERNKEHSKANDERKLHRLANIFPRHLNEIKEEATQLGMSFDENEVNYGAELGLKYHQMILLRIRYAQK